MNYVQKRLEKLEQHNAVKEESGPRKIIYLSYYETTELPNVFDRPLEDWELFKRVAGHKGLSAILTVDPYAEAGLRGGSVALCPASRYTEWKVQQNKQLRPKSAPEIVMFAHSDNNDIGQNCTKPHIFKVNL